MSKVRSSLSWRDKFRFFAILLGPFSTNTGRKVSKAKSYSFVFDSQIVFLRCLAKKLFYLYLQYRWHLLFAALFCANSLIHISKLSRNDNFLVKTFYLWIQDSQSVQNDGTYLSQITRETCTKEKDFPSK